MTLQFILFILISFIERFCFMSKKPNSFWISFEFPQFIYFILAAIIGLVNATSYKLLATSYYCCMFYITSVTVITDVVGGSVAEFGRLDLGDLIWATWFGWCCYFWACCCCIMNSWCYYCCWSCSVFSRLADVLLDLPIRLYWWFSSWFAGP